MAVDLFELVQLSEFVYVVHFIDSFVQYDLPKYVLSATLIVSFFFSFSADSNRFLFFFKT